MGKEQPKKQQVEKPAPAVQEGQQKQKTDELKRKIIKKIPVKSTLSANQQDDLKNWKPTKIEKKVNNVEPTKPKEQNLAEAFLKSLSKPVNKPSAKQPFFYDDDEPIKLAPRPILNLAKPTPEQIKWDIEDQTFIQKQFIPNKKIQHNLEQEPEDAEEANDVVIDERLKGGSEVKMKHIDLSKMINDNWKQAAQRKTARNELWQGAQGLLDGRGNLAKLARQAQQKSFQIQSELNKRSYEKKQMKNRYGW